MSLLKSTVYYFLRGIISTPLRGKITPQVGVYVCPQNAPNLNWSKIYRGVKITLITRSNFSPYRINF